MTKDEIIAELVAALQPLAGKWLYPDDLDWQDPDSEPESDDTSREELWFRRSEIRAARKAIALAKEITP